MKRFFLCVNSKFTLCVCVIESHANSIWIGCITFKKLIFCYGEFERLFVRNAICMSKVLCHWLVVVVVEFFDSHYGVLIPACICQTVANNGNVVIFDVFMAAEHVKQHIYTIYMVFNVRSSFFLISLILSRLFSLAPSLSLCLFLTFFPSPHFLFCNRLQATHDIPHKRWPCSVCGSIKMRFRLHSFAFKS